MTYLQYLIVKHINIFCASVHFSDQKILYTFKYNLFAPPTSWFLKRCAGIQKGAGAPGKEVVASVSVKAVYEIAKSKQAFDPVLQEIPLQSLAKTIVASAKSMGIQIVGGNSSKKVSVTEVK